jgi:hypothetical protein
MSTWNDVDRETKIEYSETSNGLELACLWLH